MVLVGDLPSYPLQLFLGQTSKPLAKAVPTKMMAPLSKCTMLKLSSNKTAPSKLANTGIK